MTKVMTKEQYMDYSECRQASFTYKKAKKFRDWVEAPMNDDIMEVLGFLAWEVRGVVPNTHILLRVRVCVWAHTFFNMCMPW